MKTVDYFNKIKDYIHLNLQTIFKDYENGNMELLYLHIMAVAIEMKMELEN